AWSPGISTTRYTSQKLPATGAVQPVKLVRQRIIIQPIHFIGHGIGLSFCLLITSHYLRFCLLPARGLARLPDEKKADDDAGGARDVGPHAPPERLQPDHD